MSVNESIKCDVKKCIYNLSGENCDLNEIQVTCGENGCTRCGSFSDAE